MTRSPIIDIETADYEWTAVGVWNIDGKWMWATDSGCSCYSAWESDDDYYEMRDVNETWAEFDSAVHAAASDAADATEFLAKAHKLIRGAA